MKQNQHNRTEAEEDALPKRNTEDTTAVPGMDREHAPENEEQKRTDGTDAQKHTAKERRNRLPRRTQRTNTE